MKVTIVGAGNVGASCAEYIAIKEAAIPLVIAVIVLITNFTKKPLVKILLLNDDVIDMEKLNKSLDEQDQSYHIRGTYESISEESSCNH